MHNSSPKVEINPKDFDFAVKSYAIQDNRLHIVTLENKQVFIDVDIQGFHVNDTCYESIEALLMSLSPQYQKIFHQTMLDRLNDALG